MNEIFYLTWFVTLQSCNKRLCTWDKVKDRKLDVVAKVSDKRKAKVRTTSTSKIIIVNPTV